MTDDFSDFPEVYSNRDNPIRPGIAVAVALGALTSLFLPWVYVAQTTGQPYAWSPREVPGLVVLGGFAVALVTLAAFAERKTAIPPLSTVGFSVIGVAALIITISIDTVGSALPSVGTLIHVGNKALVIGSGMGGWLAGAILIIGSVGLRARPYADWADRFLRTRLAIGRNLTALGLVTVWIGRNLAWVQVHWATGEVSLPSWALPVIGGDCRSAFMLWAVASIPVLIWRARFRLTGLVVSALCAWATLTLAVITAVSGSGLVSAIVSSFTQLNKSDVQLEIRPGVFASIAGAICALVGIVILARERSLEESLEFPEQESDNLDF